MKKKTIVWAYLLILSLGTILSLYIPKNEVSAKDAIVIPGQAIRLRILANSDLESDQALKRQVRDAVNAKISVWVKDLTSIEKARKVIKSKLPEIKATAEAVVKEEGSKQKVNVKFGKVQFPTKLYGQFLYPAGNYEAILITLGKGEGANWWCVLFPPLCFLDFSNGIAVSQGFDEKEQQAKPAVAEAKEAPKASKPVDSKAEKAEAASKVSQSQDQQEENKNSDSNQAAAVKHEDQVASAKEDDEAALANQEEQTDGAMEDDQAALANNENQTDGANEDNQAALASQDDQAAPATQEDSVKKEDKHKAKKKQAPVYTSQDEEPIKVKFFVVELWDKIF